MSASPIDIRGLSFSYTGDRDVVRDISLCCGLPGKTALIGPNGGGKTTLLLLMCGILKPRAGTVSIYGQPVRHNTFNKQVSYLFQSPDDQLFCATLYDDVAFGPLNMGLSPQTVRRRVHDALERTHMTHAADISPHHLSGGEKRLAALATLIAMRPKLYLLDEPDSNLDAKNRRMVITLLQSLPDSMWISSHDLEFLLEVCDRCVIMGDGRVAASGHIRSILSDETLLRRYHLERPHSLRSN